MGSDKMVSTEKHWLYKGISRAVAPRFLQHMAVFGHLQDEKNEHRDLVLHLPITDTITAVLDHGSCK